ncbi:ABC transporter substrate-binding protein [Lujinxingia vulgaris]|uniref:ABC transporter substrate-binding protein n=1 Tax=Lujinxingia vulgaris TaxID=2600176 RepID=A0A5C6X1M9_9DELT|nr:ABC transporter substrate-binding protein [Lujinxingia vulgaris]TXD34160.1 ABC transporter substrate-binding protein [Lujinxingia vulgaris]
MNLLHRLIGSSALATALLFGALSSGGCSLLIETETCQSDADCSVGTCTADNICTDGAAATCSDDTPCPEGQLCGEDDQCVSGSGLLAPPCELSYGNIAAENAFNLGVLLPLSGPEEGFGRPLLNAIRLAQNDFNGIGGVLNRPVGLIVCDTQGLDDEALAGARHLVEEAGVEAIIGPDYSSQTIDIATSLTIDNEVVLISPSATAATISGLSDNDLVWRTAASDVIQGIALGELLTYMLADVVEAEAPKLALLTRRDDTYADGLQSALIAQLPAEITGGDNSRFAPYSYANASAGQTGDDYFDTVGEVIADAASTGEPDVVVILGSSEAWEIAAALDEGLSGSPLYVFVDAARNTDQAQAAPESLQGRIWGTAPQNIGAADYAPYISFRLKYLSEYNRDPNDFQFVANAFDALYVVALGAAGEGFTGPEIAEGMKRLSSGNTVDPGQSQAQSAINTLRGGGSINFRGASGPLNFDEKGDPQASPIALWCFDSNRLPEAGVILNEMLEFVPQLCGQDPFDDEPIDEGDTDADVGPDADIDASDADEDAAVIGPSDTDLSRDTD